MERVSFMYPFTYCMVTWVFNSISVGVVNFHFCFWWWQQLDIVMSKTWNSLRQHNCMFFCVIVDECRCSSFIIIYIIDWQYSCPCVEILCNYSPLSCICLKYVWKIVGVDSHKFSSKLSWPSIWSILWHDVLCPLCLADVS